MKIVVFGTGSVGDALIREFAGMGPEVTAVPGGPRSADVTGLPAQFAPLVDAHQHALDLLNSAPQSVDRFHLDPAGEFGPRNPGARTGSYRTNSTALVTNEEKPLAARCSRLRDRVRRRTRAPSPTAPGSR